MIAKDILAQLRSKAPLFALGTEAPRQQLGLVSTLIEHESGNAECVTTACGVANWSWQFNPFAFEPVIAVHTCPNWPSMLGPDAARVFRGLRPFIFKDDSDVSAAILADSFEGILELGDPQFIVKFCMINFRDPEKALTALAIAWESLLKVGKPELVPDLLNFISFPDNLKPLHDRLLAELACITASPDEALATLESVPDGTWPWWKAYMQAEMHLRLGNTDEAVRLLTGLWKKMPWNMNLILKLHDLLFPLSRGANALTGQSINILLYTWNKAKLIADTLDSLAQTEIGDARIFVLNNGSTDATGDILKQAADRFGERFQIVELPVNIGAPAARNWLASLPEVQSADWAAYLDDDVILPADWLTHLAAAATAFKQSNDKVGAVGCRIQGGDYPHPLQSADYNMYPPRFIDKDGQPVRDRIGIFGNCSEGFDLGLFTYNRPALSVSGCCHLISTEALEKAGAFDIRFTPTQFDDLERDMRSTLAGFPNYYAGSFSIRHVQHSSLAKAQTDAQRGHINANKRKIEGCFSNSDLTTLAETNLNMLWDDVLHKQQQLIAAL